MHIKSLTISGFKSYRDATVAGPFSPGHNVVVGRNGSGKSNFFDGVRFLLSDSFASLRGEERVALLHEGAGASVLSAYVEMEFDNSDRRLPFDKDTVALRRMVGLQKDEYILDRKSVTRTEVFNLLESAGFSRSNPYYIVQQGKVAALCAMSDKNRLDLLKEVAGTRVYDERREESLRIMSDTDAKRDKISEVVEYIEARLAELDSEKDELKAYQRLDRDRRALEYTIRVKELESAKEALEELSNRHAELSSTGQTDHTALAALHAKISTADREEKTLQAELNRLQEDRSALNETRRKAADNVARLDVELTEAKAVASNAAEAVDLARTELATVEASLEAKRQELEPMEGAFTAARDRERSARSEVALLEAAVLSLQVKAGRASQFSSVDERNTYLRRELREAQKTVDTARRQKAKAESDIERLEAGRVTNLQKVQENRAEVLTLERDVSAMEARAVRLRAERDAVHAQRHEKWRSLAELESKTNALTGNLKRLEAVKRAAFGTSTFHAIRVVMEASREDPQGLGPNRVFGPLVELIDVDEKFTTAADVTAGNTLTHVLVDSDATAARLVRILQDRRAGRVTFIPLNRLNQTPPTPPQATADAIPLVRKIKCDARFLPAVGQVFGRTLVTRTVQIAAQMSRDHNVDCVTLDGDQVNKHGAMTGGYVDLSRSRIDATRDLARSQADLASLEQQASEARTQASAVDVELSKLLGEIQQAEANMRGASSKSKRLRAEIDQMERYTKVDGSNIPKARERVASLEDSISAGDKRIDDIRAEIATPALAVLDSEGRRELEELQSELDTMREKVSEAAEERTKLESAVSAVRSEVEGNLERRASELQRVIETGVVASAGDETETTLPGGDQSQPNPNDVLSEMEARHTTAAADLASCEQSLSAMDSNIADLEHKLSELIAELETTRESERELEKRLEDERHRAESMHSQRALQMQKKRDAERKIRDLGSLPADFEKYQGLAHSTLMRKLKAANDELGKFSHVNKKALDQFISFTEQRESLRRRRDELDSGADAIRQLIQNLDQRKDEDIMRTFRGVSKFFSEVFAELVPGGRASLVMLKSNSRRRASQGESQAEGSAPGADDEPTAGDATPSERPARIEYSGVAMKVAFTATGEAYLLQQLSGGQKSIVALALIFAIQRLDPAPFYLFDEIDANLDATHREAVATVIRNQAGTSAQFVTTTFRPEFVNAGDKWFGVTHRNKVSTVQEVTKDVALTFINRDEAAR